MKEVELLLQRAQKYLKSAQILIKEADFESAVSRSYYAMFYAVEAALLTKSISCSTHRGVIATFGEHFIKSEIFPREMGRALNLAFEKRQLGDYEFTFVFSEEEAQELLDNAQDFVQKITGLISQPD